MSFTIRFTDKAWEDAFQIVEWYDSQKTGLGDYFIEYLNEAVLRIQDYPTAYKKVYRQVRQAGMKKFPYVVLFKAVKQTILVYGIFHTSQNPKTKFKRLR